MEKKNTGLVVLVVVLALLVVGLGGFIIYDKALSKDNKITENDNNKNENINDNNISVENSVDYVDEYYKLFNVKLPKIVGNTKKIDELNNKILNDILPRTYSHSICHAMMEDNCMNKGSSVDYKYLIKDNIVIIYIYSFVPDGGTSVPASGGGLFFYNYFYDIENDNILNISEAAEKLGIKDLDGANTYDDLINGCSSIIIENDNLVVDYNEGCV